MITRRSFLSLAGPAFAAPLLRRDGLPDGRAAERVVQSTPVIDAARLRNRLERLSYHGRKAGATFADGVSRVAYSTADLTARAWVIDEIKGADLVPRIDAAGNIFVAEWVQTGRITKLRKLS